MHLKTLSASIYTVSCITPFTTSSLLVAVSFDPLSNNCKIMNPQMS